MRIYVISPFAGDNGAEREINVQRARMICREIVLAGHTPFAPHLFFPQFLNDQEPEERRRGIEAGQEIMMHGKFERAWYYPKRGRGPEIIITGGMQSDMDAARSAGIKVERGTIGGDL